MEFVYILYHIYAKEDCEEIKNLGVFSSPFIAKKVINKYRNLPDFKDLPYNFEIAKYKIDREEWSEGYYQERYFL